MLNRHTYCFGLPRLLGSASLAALLLLVARDASAQQLPGLSYPPAQRGEVTDDYFGTRVPDPYRWLEALDSEPVRGFVQAQNALSQPYLEKLPQRPWIKAQLTKLWSYERYGVPRKEGGRYFFLHNDGTQNQSALLVTESLAEPGRVLLDPNIARGDATIALARFVPSPDGKLLAYSLSDGGTDWEIWRIRRVADGIDLPDELRQTKFWGFSWSRDSRGAYYSRYPARAGTGTAAGPGTTAGAGAAAAAALPAKGDDQAQPAIYYHRIGETQAQDQLIYRVTDHPRRAPSAEVSDDGRYLIVSLFDGYEANGIRLIDLRKPGSAARELFAAWDAQYSVVGTRGDTFFVRTTHSAPLGRVIAVDVKQPQPARWRNVIPESDMALDGASYVGGRLIASYVRDAHAQARLYRTDGQLLGNVPLPGLGTVTGFDGHGPDSETFFAYADYLNPSQILRYDVSSNTVLPFRKPKLQVDTSRYVTEQVFYTSRDGTRVPMFLTHRRDAPRDGQQPTLLYGYGGFNASATPAFRAQMLVWLEMGGVFAEANLRGGGEYGEAWHQAGTRSRKQNVFDDFIAAAEYLIRERWTTPRKLAIHGRSNGGLLVGAVLTQRPELFGAALPTVGVHDILRYHTASANARQWSTDFGLSEDPKDFAAQIRYSPVHNTRPGVCYPPTLVTTADHDDRVVPWHSYKFAAALQRDQGCPNPVLIRVETRAGHGPGKPVWMQIDDFADQWAFVAEALGMSMPASP